MDSMGLLMAALQAGAGDTAESAVRDAHEALLAQLRMRLAGRSDGEAALAGFAAYPDSGEDALRAELAAAGADGDEDLLTSARAVLSVADAPGWRAGKYTDHAPGDQAHPDE